MNVSVIIPIFNSAEKDIQELYGRLKNVLEHLNEEYEIILVDDGSTLETYSFLEKIAEKDVKFKVIRLTRNFGQTAAFLAGYEYSSYEAIITLDADLQCAPEEIPLFLEKIQMGYDLCSGFREKRNDPGLRKFCSFVMNKIMFLRTQTKLLDWGCSYMAFKRELVEEFKIYGNQLRYIKFLVGYHQKKFIEIAVKHFPKKDGASTYTLVSLFLVAMDFIFLFSFKVRKQTGPLFEVKEVLNTSYV